MNSFVIFQTFNSSNECIFMSEYGRCNNPLDYGALACTMLTCIPLLYYVAKISSKTYFKHKIRSPPGTIICILRVIMASLYYWSKIVFYDKGHYMRPTYAAKLISTAFIIHYLVYVFFFQEFISYFMVYEYKWLKYLLYITTFTLYSYLIVMIAKLMIIPVPINQKQFEAVYSGHKYFTRIVYYISMAAFVAQISMFLIKSPYKSFFSHPLLIKLRLLMSFYVIAVIYNFTLIQFVSPKYREMKYWVYQILIFINHFAATYIFLFLIILLSAEDIISQTTYLASETQSQESPPTSKFKLSLV